MKDDPVEGLSRPHLSDRFIEVRRLEGALAAYRARLVVATDQLGDRGIDGAGMLRSAGRMSSRAAQTVSRTAAGLAEMPLTAASLAEGKITAEHAVAVAQAAEIVSPERADKELLSSAESAPADVFAKRSREWAGRNRPNDGLSDHERKRARRTVTNWKNNEGMGVWLAELDPTANDTVAARINERYEQLWRDDGGRDGSPDEIRTRTQRLADAFVELVCGGRADSSKPAPPRHQLTALFDVSRMRADDPEGFAQIVDGEALPQAVLERLACNSEITGVIFDGPGRPIWVGRDYRSATVANWKALIARDRGCVGCGASPSRCEAHHVIAWNDLGPTDITNLVLLCSRCHHDVHDRGMELRRTEDGWRIEPRAGPPTLPPGRPPGRRGLQPGLSPGGEKDLHLAA